MKSFSLEEFCAIFELTKPRGIEILVFLKKHGLIETHDDIRTNQDNTFHMVKAFNFVE
jgi:hypothetical protein